MQTLGVQLAVVVVNPQLFGVDWMIQALRRTHGHFKVVSIADENADVANVIRADATLKRPGSGGPPSHDEWLGRVLEILGHLIKSENGTDG